jgi:hypothetical protein
MNKIALLAYADANLAARGVVPSALYVPPFYTNEAASDLAKAGSEEDTYNVAVFARAYLYTRDQKYTDAISSILTNWSKGCTSISTKDDTPLVVCYHWFKVFEAIQLISTSDKKTAAALATLIQPFAVTTLLPAFQSISGNFNNWQSWSLYARATLFVMQTIIGTTAESATTLKAQISKHLTWSTINWPFINRKNEFWTENVRGNNALRYTQFSLAPMVLADRALKGGENFTPYINAFAANCRNTSGYFNRYGTSSLVGKITKLFASSDPTPQYPEPSGWSGRFFFFLTWAGYPVSVRDLYAPVSTFNIDSGGELLYFVENDAELGLI